MKSTIKSFFQNKFVKWGAIPIVLLLLWLASLVLIVQKESFTIITQTYDRSVFDNFSTKSLLKGSKMTGEFQAKTDNLGIVSVRFQPRPYLDTGEDEVIFRIKEKDTNNWHAENVYFGNLLSGLPLFPFGFEKISDSKNKIYVFEIESKSGNSENAFALSDEEPITVTHHQYVKEEIFRSISNITNFTFLKFASSFQNIDTVVSSLPYLLPLVFYLIPLIINSELSRRNTKLKYNRFTKFPLMHVIVLFILLDSTITHTELNFIVYSIFIALWILTIKIYKLDASITVLYSAIFFAAAFLSHIFGSSSTVERFSSWSYIFLAIGIFQLAIDSKANDKQKTDYRSYLSLFTTSKKS